MFREPPVVSSASGNDRLCRAGAENGQEAIALLSAREKEIRKLIEQIPPENVALAEALAKKVKGFRLDKIIDLTSNEKR